MDSVFGLIGKMIRRPSLVGAICFTRVVLPALFYLLFVMGATAVAEQLPNIVVIFADDLGYGDVGCYGATKIATPNIDRLAGQGMKFTEAHAAASLCSPSRYGLLTGRSPWRLHKKGNGYRLEPGQMTIANFLKDSGYKSAAIGKWHLGYGDNWNKPPISGPLEVGFDYHFGVPSNHNDSTRVFIEDHDIFGRATGEEYKVIDKGRELPEGVNRPRQEDQVDTMLTEKAVEFIRRNVDHPFFLYFTPCAPHTHVTPDADFRGTSKAGLYGDHVQELDSHVGTILETLDALGLADNTLVIFTSDNGSTPKDFKGTNKVHLNLADDSNDVRRRFKTAKADAKKLGHVTNGQWRDGKGRAYEGGHRVPFIARWPGQIKPATESPCTINLTDLFATFGGIANQELPEDAAEDSFSLLPVLRGKESQVVGRERVFILGNGKDSSVAVCGGKWKLIVRYGVDQERGHELYDLAQDPGEIDNLATEYPEVVKQLAGAYHDAEAAGRTRP